MRDELDRQFFGGRRRGGDGQAVKPAKLAQLAGGSPRKAHGASPLPCATRRRKTPLASRRFLDDLDAAAKALKDGTTAGIVNPRWATEGTTVPDLVRHMTKYKLLFGPAGKNGGEAYLALHRGLAAYHLALNQQAVAQEVTVP